MEPWEDRPEDQFRSGEVLDVIRDHERRMAELRPQMELHKAVYITEYWNYRINRRAGLTTEERTAFTQIATEVNRTWLAVEQHANQLYPKAPRAVFGPDIEGRGDPVVAQAAAAEWWRLNHPLGRVLQAVRQGVLYTGSAFKVDVTEGRGSPIARTGVRVVPPWECVLDLDAGDVRDERFRGHLCWVSTKVLERRYPRLGTLKGMPKADFLRVRDATGAAWGGASSQRWDTNVISGPGSANVNADGLMPQGQGGFAQVFEFYNLEDGIEVGGHDYLGRMEVFVLGQGEKVSRRPVAVVPMPFSTASGEPRPNIVPLLFAFEPEWPLRGVSPAKRWMRQQEELDEYRTEIARRTRQMVPKLMARSDVVGSDTATKLMSPVANELVLFDTTEDLRLAVVPLPSPPVDPDILEYAAQADRDLGVNLGTSPNARGQPLMEGKSPATAREVQLTAIFTESEFGKHAAVLNQVLLEVTELAVRGMSLALQQQADAAGAGVHGGVKVAAVGTVANSAVEEPSGPADALADATGGLLPAAAPGAGEGPPVEATAVAAATPQGTVAVVPQQAFCIVDRQTGKRVQMTADALTGDFDITFVEGTRTPMTTAARQQALVSLQERYFGMWDLVQKGGPIGVLAYRWMLAMHDEFELPEDVHPDKLREAAKGEAPAPPPPSTARASEHGPSEAQLAGGAIRQVQGLARDPALAGMVGEAADAMVGGDVEAATRALLRAQEAASMTGDAQVGQAIEMVLHALQQGDAGPVGGAHPVAEAK